MGQCKWLFCKRRRFREDGHEHSRAYACAAGAPESAGAAGNAFPTTHHFKQRPREIQIAAGIPVRRQKSRAHHDMMLRPVHVAERHLHHLPQDLDRIFGSRGGTKPDQGVHALCVAGHLDNKLRLEFGVTNRENAKRRNNRRP